MCLENRIATKTTTQNWQTKRWEMFIGSIWYVILGKQIAVLDLPQMEWNGFLDTEARKKIKVEGINQSKTKMIAYRNWVTHAHIQIHFKFAITVPFTASNFIYIYIVYAWVLPYPLRKHLNCICASVCLFGTNYL